MDAANWKIHPAYIAAALMIVEILVQGSMLLQLYQDVGDLFTPAEIAKSLLPMAVMSVMAMYLLLTKHDNLVKVLSGSAFAVGFMCMYDSYILLVEYKEVMAGDLEVFLQGVINFAIALMLTANAIVYYRGLSRSTTMIFYGVIGLLAIFVLFVIIDLHQGTSFLSILDAYKDSVGYYSLLILMLIMLRSDSVKVNTTMYVITSSISDMRKTFAADGLSIQRHLAEKLLRREEGHICCSMHSFLLETFYKDKFMMNVENVNGRDVVSIRAIENDSGVDIIRFTFKGAWVDTGDIGTCDLLRIYGDDGFYIQMIVRDGITVKAKKVPLRGVMRLTSQEPGTKSHRYKVKWTRITETVKGWILGPGYERKYLE